MQNSEPVASGEAEDCTREHTDHTTPTEMKILMNGLDQGFENVMKRISSTHQLVERLPETIAALVQGSHVNTVASERVSPVTSEAQEVANDLITRNKELENEKGLLESRLEKSDEAIATSAAQQAQLVRQVADLKNEVARLGQKEAQFRDIILQNASVQKVTDEQVIQAFSDLRQTVQQLAKSQTFDLTHPPLLSKNLTQRMRHFYNNLRGLSPKDVGARFKAEIFDTLQRHIFSKTMFGLRRRDPEEDGKEEPLWSMESYLQKFDSMLQSNTKVSENAIADWRICTLECVKMLKIPEEFSIYVADIMSELFDPLISRNASKAQRDNVWDKILDISRKAYQLKMMMQHSKEGYAVQSLDMKEYRLYSKAGHYAEALGVEDGKSSEASDEISYVLFGALVKHMKHMGGKMKPLEKAEVILKKR